MGAAASCSGSESAASSFSLRSSDNFGTGGTDVIEKLLEVVKGVVN